MALVRKVGPVLFTRQVIRRRVNNVIFLQLLPHENSHDATEIPLPAEMEAEARRTLQTMLPRPIIDVLVRYFVAEVNW